MNNEFMDPLDEAFEDWWNLFLEVRPEIVKANENTAVVDIFKKAFYEAYRAGWLDCETWCKIDDIIPEELN